MANEDFDIDTLAVYLHLTPAQISRMADRGRLPGRKIRGVWKFSEAEVHHWLEDRIGVSDEEELIEVETVLEGASGNETTVVSISQALPIAAIEIPLQARTRGSVIARMAHIAAQSGLLWDPARIEAAVRRREKLHPTALDNGVALLHPRRPVANALAESFLTLGITPQGIPFGGKLLTDIFFLICSQSDAEHLRLLARLSRLINDTSLLIELREAGEPAAARSIIEVYERQLLG